MSAGLVHHAAGAILALAACCVAPSVGWLTGEYGVRGVGVPLLGAPRLGAQARPVDSLVVATYNIRHGRGMDGALNLERTAATIRSFGAAIVALQEVDRRVERSDRVDQPDSLGALLRLEHAFGAFFPYQGGEYGMAILSAYPIRRTTSIRLPDGNEPRIALLAEIELPGRERIAVVNVHFDWVAGDAFRFAQVEALAGVLDTLTLPFILLGDFNDQPGTRTLTTWANRAMVAAKPEDGRFTFSSTEPTKEIDHILLGPPSAWSATTSRVVNEPLTSDHRPVVATVRRAAP